MEYQEQQTEMQLYRQDNELLTACYELSLNAKRLVLLAICKLDQLNMPQRSEMQIYAAEFAQHFPSNNAYRELKQAAEELYEATVYIKSRPGNTKKQRWVQNCEYQDKEGWVSFQFANVMETYLTCLLDHYTEVDLIAVRELRSIYSLRLYELLSRFTDTGWYYVTVSELRDMFCLQDKYKKFAELERKVIKRAIAEINDSTPMQIGKEIEKVKNGRTIVGMKFRFRMRDAAELSLRQQVPLALVDAA